MDLIYWSGPGKQCSQRSLVATNKQTAQETFVKIIADTRGHLYKIGISANPQGRSYGHEGVEVDRRKGKDGLVYITLQEGLWASMHVIYRTDSENTIRNAEIDLISFATKTFGGALKDKHIPGQMVFPFNINPGGGGPLPEDGPYFLYVLRSQA